MIHAEITKRLTELGWLAEDGAAIASKIFQTAVGPKAALAYLMDFGPHSDKLFLSGDYQSEGRNVLASHATPIPRSAHSAHGDTLDHLVVKFARGVDAVVADSYAARLLRL